MVDELSDYTKQVINKLMKGEMPVSQGRAIFELLQLATDLVGLTGDLRRRELARMSR